MDRLLDQTVSSHHPPQNNLRLNVHKAAPVAGARTVEVPRHNVHNNSTFYNFIWWRIICTKIMPPASASKTTTKPEMRGYHVRLAERTGPVDCISLAGRNAVKGTHKGPTQRSIKLWWLVAAGGGLIC